MASALRGATAIVGIGQTAFGKGLPDTELSLACQAISMALDDAGIEPSEVDGIASYTMEPNREVEVAPHVQPARREGLRSREIALAQAQPRHRVRPDRDVRRPAGRAAPHADAVAGRPHLPRVPQVPEPHVVGRLEPGRCAEIAIGERLESRIHDRKPLRVGEPSRHRRAPYTAVRPLDRGFDPLYTTIAGIYPLAPGNMCSGRQRLGSARDADHHAPRHADG